MNKPRILIVPDLERKAGKAIFRLEGAYLTAVEEAGGIPVLSSYRPSSLRELLGEAGGILIAGGDFDINPRYYREKPLPGLGQLKPERTECEFRLLRLALEGGYPVLGICGGMQLINVGSGGSLFQDLECQVAGGGSHRSRGDGRNFHPVAIEKESRLGRIIGKKNIRVNSTHRQAVKALGRNLRASAYAPDGVIEAIESNSRIFVLGVQWHPERLTRAPEHQRIFAAFIRAARQKAGSVSICRS